MDDDFNEQFDEIFGGEGDTPDLTPTWRATIRRGRLMLTGWAPWLITGGPMGNLLPERARSGVTIADLTIHCEDQNEVSVHYLVRTDRDYDPEEILARLGAAGRPSADLVSRSHGRAPSGPRADHRRDGPLRQLPRALVRRDAGVLARRPSGEGVSEVVPDVRVRDASVDRPPGSPRGGCPAAQGVALVGVRFAAP